MSKTSETNKYLILLQFRIIEKHPTENSKIAMNGRKRLGHFLNKEDEEVERID